MAVCADIEVFRNSDRTYAVTLYQDGAAADARGWTFSFVAKGRFGDSSPVITLSSGSGISFATDGSDGRIVLAFSNTVDNLSHRRIPYSLVRTNPGARDVLRYGDLVVFDNPAN